MVTPLRKDWAWKMQKSLGYMVVDDDEELRAFNKCIKGIIQSQRQKQEGRNMGKKFKKRFKEFTKKVKKVLKKWNWKKFLLGCKRPAIVIIASSLTWLGGIDPSWAWIGGVSAERIWMTIEWVLTNF